MMRKASKRANVCALGAQGGICILAEGNRDMRRLLLPIHESHSTDRASARLQSWSALRDCGTETIGRGVVTRTANSEYSGIQMLFAPNFEASDSVRVKLSASGAEAEIGLEPVIKATGGFNGSATRWLSAGMSASLSITCRHWRSSQLGRGNSSCRLSMGSGAEYA